MLIPFLSGLLMAWGFSKKDFLGIICLVLSLLIPAFLYGIQDFFSGVLINFLSFLGVPFKTMTFQDQRLPQVLAWLFYTILMPTTYWIKASERDEKNKLEEEKKLRIEKEEKGDRERALWRKEEDRKRVEEMKLKKTARAKRQQEAEKREEEATKPDPWGSGFFGD